MATSNEGSSAKKDDDHELVSRFLAPLCARDEKARNIALAAARTTVESWLNNNWEIESPRDELFSKRKVTESVAIVRKGGARSGLVTNSYDALWEDTRLGCAKFSSSFSDRTRPRDDDDDLGRNYGKSPKFEDGLENRYNRRKRGNSEEQELHVPEPQRIVFNTLEGFGNGEEQLLRETELSLDEIRREGIGVGRERKISVGQLQTKRSLPQEEEASWKYGKTLGSPEVTPGDVGRMLNLGNALDGPRQAQANKYLSLVSLHLPVILRLSVNCPFQNVRIKCAEIIRMVKVSIMKRKLLNTEVYLPPKKLDFKMLHNP